MKNVSVGLTHPNILIKSHDPRTEKAGRGSNNCAKFVLKSVKKDRINVINRTGWNASNSLIINQIWETRPKSRGYKIWLNRFAKARVAGSNPVSRSIFSRGYKTLSPGNSLDCAKIVLNFSGALSKASIPGLRLSG